MARITITIEDVKDGENPWRVARQYLYEPNTDGTGGLGPQPSKAKDMADKIIDYIFKIREEYK